MELDAARQFMRQHHRAILTTYRGAGPVRMSPVVAGVDHVGRAIVSTRETLYKVKHLRRDPRISLCVFTDAFFGQWIQVDGTAAILSLPDALEPLVDYYRAISGEHDDWDEYRAAMTKQRKCLLRLTIERWGPIATGGFPPELAD